MRSFSWLSVPLSFSVVHQNAVVRECNSLARMIARSDEAAIFCTAAASSARNKSDFPRGATQDRKSTREKDYT